VKKKVERVEEDAYCKYNIELVSFGPGSNGQSYHNAENEPERPRSQYVEVNGSSTVMRFDRACG
jgi:hypothetical protein